KGVLAMNPAREVKTERFSRTEAKWRHLSKVKFRSFWTRSRHPHTQASAIALCFGSLRTLSPRIGAVVNLKVEDYFLQGNGFYSVLKTKAAKRKSSQSTTSWRSSWMNTSKRPAWAPSQVLLCSRPLSDGRSLKL